MLSVIRLYHVYVFLYCACIKIYLLKLVHQVLHDILYKCLQGAPVADEDLFVAVKTCEKFHEDRGINLLSA